ncbi:MAG: hypothetical protein IJ104_03015 [Methanobrevibacter sp.]|nr:hypothetical protein [Methanobrevibacter sp.]
MARRMKFEDVDDWTPSSISIVDEPFHPLCKFEVYENDDEYIAKSIEIQNEGEKMSDQTPEQNEQMVSAPVSFFERLLNRNVGKSAEIPPAPKKKEEEQEEVSNADIMKALKSFDERLSKLEEEEEEKKKPTEPVNDAVQKSEGETSEESETEETSEEEEEKTVDEQEGISKSVDPDLARNSQTEAEQSFRVRMGRKENGMSW